MLAVCTRQIAKGKEIAGPFLIIHGSDEEVIPYELGKKLFEQYAGKKRMVEIARGGHNDLEKIDLVPYRGSIQEFLGVL